MTNFVYNIGFQTGNAFFDLLNLIGFLKNEGENMPKKSNIGL